MSKKTNNKQRLARERRQRVIEEQKDREQLQSTADAMLCDLEEYKLKAQAFSDMLQEERDRLENEEEAPVE